MGHCRNAAARDVNESRWPASIELGRFRAHVLPVHVAGGGDWTYLRGGLRRRWAPGDGGGAGGIGRASGRLGQAGQRPPFDCGRLGFLGARCRTLAPSGGWSCAASATRTTAGQARAREGGGGTWDLLGSGSPTTMVHFDHSTTFWQRFAADGADQRRAHAKGNTDPWAKTGRDARQGATDPGVAFTASTSTPANGRTGSSGRAHGSSVRRGRRAGRLGFPAHPGGGRGSGARSAATTSSTHPWGTFVAGSCEGTMGMTGTVAGRDGVSGGTTTDVLGTVPGLDFGRRHHHAAAPPPDREWRPGRGTLRRHRQPDADRLAD